MRELTCSERRHQRLNLAANQNVIAHIHRNEYVKALRNRIERIIKDKEREFRRVFSAFKQESLEQLDRQMR